MSPLRFHRLAAAGLVLAASAAAARAGAPPVLLHARLEARSVAPGGMAAAMRDLAAGPSRWIAWAAPLENRKQRMCCLECAGFPAAVRSAAAGGCRLGQRGGWNLRSGDDDLPILLEAPADFLVFAKTSGGQIEDLRVFSSDCPIDAEGAAVIWLDGVRPEEGVPWLETLLSSTGDGEDLRDVPQSAVAAIALQAGPAADAALRRAVAPDRPLALRDRAAFWLAEARGESGCAILLRIVPGDSDARFREKGTFALSRCRGEAAVAALVGLARRDAASDVRSRALFWLAQAAGRKAAAAIDDAIRDDPDTEVKKQAVFALTQMPESEGVPQLIRVARTNRNPEVRERAVFWLGQSRDPRALDFIEEILSSP